MQVFLPAQVTALSKLAAETSRFGATTGLMVKEKEGVVRIEATDGRCLGILQVENKWDEPPNPFKPQIEGDELASVILPLVNELQRENGYRVTKTKVLDAFKGKDKEFVGLVTKDGSIYLGTDSMPIRPVDGRFPNVDQLFEKQKPLFTITFDPNIMIRVIEAARSIGTATESGVTLIYYGADKPIGISCKSGEGMFFDGLVVPLVRPKKKAEPEKPKIAEGTVEAEPPGEYAGPGDDDDDDEDEDEGEDEIAELDRRHWMILKLAADSPEKLRGIDVERVIENAYSAGLMPSFSEWLLDLRPDLAQHVEGCIADHEKGLEARYYSHIMVDPKDVPLSEVYNLLKDGQSSGLMPGLAVWLANLRPDLANEIDLVSDELDPAVDDDEQEAEGAM